MITFEQTNPERARAALQALEAGGYQPAQEEAWAVSDLVTDLHHLAEASGWSWEDILHRAQADFRAETEGER